MDKIKMVNEINNCNKIEFLWYQRNDGVQHTGILLRGDDQPICTIDFGTSLGSYGSGIGSSSVSSKKKAQISSAASSSPVTGGISIDHFDENKSKIKGLIVEVNAKNKELKEKLIEAIDGLLTLEMGQYHLSTNNCRDHLLKSMKFLYKFWEDCGSDCVVIDKAQYNNFKKVFQIQKNDSLNIAFILSNSVIVLAVIVLIILIRSK